MWGCSNEEEEVDIYASIYPVYYLLTEIVQDKLTVKQIYPMGKDVHEYDPGTPSALVKMNKADLMFYIGAGLEGFIEKAKTTAFKNSNLKLIELTEYIKLCEQTEDGYQVVDSNHSTSHLHTADTHVWLDPLRMAKFVDVILEEVTAFYPEHKDLFSENAVILKDKLINLDNLFNSALNEANLERIMIVDHDSYLYWEERYGIKRIRTRNDNESCDVVISEVIPNIEKAKSYNIKYVVTTANESVCSIINTYVEGLGATIKSLNHLTSLTQNEIDNNRDYISIMKKNLETLLEVFPAKKEIK